MPKSSVFRFSTAEFPERQRIAVYREVFGRCATLDITPLCGECRAEVEWHVLPGASVMWGSNSAHRYMWGGTIAQRFRKGPDLGKTDDDCLITWAMNPTHFQHLGKEITVETGAATLMSCVDRATVEHARPIRHVTVKVPRATLKPLIAGLEDAFMRPVSAEADALRLLKSYAETVRIYENAGSALRHAMVLHVCDLIALAFGAAGDTIELAGRRGLPAARLDAMKKHMLAHLDEPSFSVKDVARAQGVSPRYVQMLFDRDGLTFSSFLLQSRLALAHRRLSDPASARLPIGTIAIDCGFGDLSYFNQSFRRAYGETPTDVRSRARRGRD